MLRRSPEPGRRGLAPRALLAAALALLITASAPPAGAGSWTGYDKVQHFTFSFLFTLGIQYGLESKLDIERWRALPISIGASFSIGLAKELYDWKLGTPGYASYRDMVANGAGIAGATVVIAW